MLPCSACILLLPLPHVSLLVVLVTDRVLTFFFFFLRSEDDDDFINADENVGLGELHNFCCSFFIVSDEELTDNRSSLPWSSSSSISCNCCVISVVGGKLFSSDNRMMSFVSRPFASKSAVTWSPFLLLLSGVKVLSPDCAVCCAQQQLTRHDTDPTTNFVHRLMHEETFFTRLNDTKDRNTYHTVNWITPLAYWSPHCAGCKSYELAVSIQQTVADCCNIHYDFRLRAALLFGISHQVVRLVLRN